MKQLRFFDVPIEEWNHLKRINQVQQELKQAYIYKNDYKILRKDFEKFFVNVNKMLKHDGILIMDHGGPEDNIMDFFVFFYGPGLLKWLQMAPKWLQNGSNMPPDGPKWCSKALLDFR